jgi:hypothetical protein
VKARSHHACSVARPCWPSQCVLYGSLAVDYRRIADATILVSEEFMPRLVGFSTFASLPEEEISLKKQARRSLRR